MISLLLCKAFLDKIDSIIERITKNNKKIIHLIKLDNSKNGQILINYLNNENKCLLALLK